MDNKMFSHICSCGNKEFEIGILLNQIDESTFIEENIMKKADTYLFTCTKCQTQTYIRFASDARLPLKPFPLETKNDQAILE